jgi:hypothetical protein
MEFVTNWPQAVAIIGMSFCAAIVLCLALVGVEIMRSWVFASFCTLGLGLLNKYMPLTEPWTVYQFFTATCLFGIFLKLRD